MNTTDSKVLNYACAAAEAEVELLRSCPPLDRMAVVGDAVMLLLAAILLLIGWSAFFASFLPLYSALPSAALIALMIAMIDRRVVSSDWTLAGVLRRGVPPWDWWLKLAFRLSIAFLFALATATGLSLALNRPALDDWLQAKRDAYNLPIREQYDALKADARELIVGTRQRTYDDLLAERETVERQIGEKETAVSDDRRRASEARLKALREKEGTPGFHAGEGPLYKEAELIRKDAESASTVAGTELAALNQRFAALEGKVAASVAALQAANAEYANETRRLDAEMVGQVNWKSDKAGPLDRWMAYDALRSDPDVGPAVRHYHWIFTITLVTLELAFVVTKLVFGHASHYHVRLIRRAREFAAEQAYQHQAALRSFRTAPGVRRPAPMRLIVSDRPPGQADRRGDAR